MEFKGTKGEWELDVEGNDGEDCRSQITVGGEYGAIDVWNLPSSLITEKERLCNAKLVAAAPDLLAALIRVNKVINDMELNDRFGNTQTYLKEAIIKAL